MSQILAYKNRGRTLDLTVTNAAGTAITPGPSDKLRVVIGREGQLGVGFADAALVVVSGAPTDNGSSLTIGGGGSATSHRLRLDAADMNFAAGVYTMFVDYYDEADAQEWKNVSRQVFCLENT